MTAHPIPRLYPTGDGTVVLGQPAVRVLGPLELFGEPAPSARKTRQTLALLAMNANKLTSVNELARELWDGNDPSKALQSIQSYVLMLRRIPQVRIDYRDPGYVLVVPSSLDVDARRFVDYAERARLELRIGRLAAAEDLLRAAFSLWRGRPLEDVQTGPLLSRWAERLDDQYQTALDLRAEIDLRAGRHREIADDLADRARAYPGREDTTRHLMVALYRSNRRADALDAFQRLRVALVEAYGLEPCPELQRLHRAVLTGDPSLELRGGAA